MRERKSIDSKMIRPIPGEVVLSAPEWEYKTVIASRSADLNALCLGAWELVAVTAQPGDMATYYFKRIKA